MKTINKIFIAVLIIFCYSFSKAQQNQTSNSQLSSSQEQTLKQHQKNLKEAEEIFEGNVTHQESYKNTKGELWTCTVFQITKIFKGNPQITLGSIKVVTFQSNGSQKVLDGGPSLGKSGTYIILGKPADTSMLNDKMITTDNSLTLSPYFGIIAITGDVYEYNNLVKAHAEWLGGYRNPGTSYKTLDDLYSFLKENGLSAQEEVEQPTMPADTTKQQKQK